MEKIAILLFRIFMLKMLIVLSIVLFILPFAPGVCSNFVAWLETDGSIAAFIAALCLVSFAIYRIIINHRLFSSPEITVHKGVFHSTIKEGVFTQAVQALWNEYFHTSGLSVRTTLKKNTLTITGETPSDRVDINDLSSFLAGRLLKTTGFFGNIKLQIHRCSSDFRSPTVAEP